MNTFSIKAQSIVEQCIDFYIRPLCLILNKNFRIKAWSGDYAYYGFKDIIEGRDCRDSMLFLTGLSAQESTQLRFIETPNARAVHVQLIVNPDEMILVLLDATEQRDNLKVLQQNSNELALLHIEQNKLIAELKRLEKEIEFKRRQAEQANRLKGRFIATMSHEFRTPLTSILGYTSRLKQRKDFDPSALKYLASVERGAQHLLSLVENLLDQSQIEVGSLTINPIATHVNAVFDKLYSIFEPLAEDKRLQLRFDIQADIPDYLFLDEMRFRQILVNLVSNAIKFTEHGSIRVETKWSSNELKLCVEDTGKGIAEADQARVFNAFEQLGNHPGTGLGLAIVKHLVTAMGGKLTLTSDIGKGSRFELSLPAEQIAIDSNGYQNTLENHNFREKSPLNNVLIVEDDPDIMALLQGTLSEAGYSVLVASDGNEAIKKALSNWPDLILLDLNLPDITGFEVVKTLRNYDFDNPVFAQSAWASSEFKVKAIAAGCNEYLLKPLDFKELDSLISEYFIIKTDPGMPIERYKELCQQFLDTFPEKLKALQELEGKINNRNWEQSTWQALHTFTHRLAGSAGLYEMHEIADTSKQLDQLLLDYERLSPGNNPDEQKDKITNAIALLAKRIDQEISKLTVREASNLH